MDFSLTYDADPKRVIRGRVTRPPAYETGANALPAVVVVHGFKGFLRWGFFPELQRRIAERGWIAVAINLSGSGVGPDLESFTEDDSFLDSTPSRDLEDLERVHRALETSALEALTGIDAARVGLFGHSRGGGTALLHASRRGDVRAVATWAAVSRTNRFPESTHAAWRRSGVLEIPNARTGQIHRLGVGWLEDCERHAEALDILAACARSRTPTLLVHGTDDEAVPVAEARDLFAAFPEGSCRLSVIEGTGHTLGAVHPYRGETPALTRAFDETLGFFDQHLG